MAKGADALKSWSCHKTKVMVGLSFALLMSTWGQKTSSLGSKGKYAVGRVQMKPRSVNQRFNVSTGSNRFDPVQVKGKACGLYKKKTQTSLAAVREELFVRLLVSSPTGSPGTMGLEKKTLFSRHVICLSQNHSTGIAVFVKLMAARQKEKP